jgi:hypothetical protein
MAMPYFIRMSSLSMVARGTTGIPACLAAATSGFNDHIRFPHIFPGVTYRHLAAHLHQALRGFTLDQVRTGYLVTQVRQHLGYAGHADAADAYEVQMSCFPELYQDLTPCI